MGYHFDGYAQVRQNFLTAPLSELLSLCDALYGRENITDEKDADAVRAEALRQLDREWTDTRSPEYERVQFWTKVHKFTRQYGVDHNESR